ncbi:hypothetical protein ILUMI_08147 [Ignelater luminosus]|uniref:3'-5' exonuclease domain-containing protein n=1 Tax=Ignelater luminosus TaxID=2038154 RepID=A0A8K0DBX3_IGNLU|nr:hypothetical protein ILUMI_08147 [Ignelater luminosus]
MYILDVYLRIIVHLFNIRYYFVIIMEFNFKIGQRLVIELTNKQIFEGDCKKCAKNRIDLCNVIEYPNKKELKGQLSYYSCEILSVRVLDDVNNDGQQDASLNSPDCETVKNGIHKPHQVIAVKKAEYARLLDMTRSYIYMATVDNRYLDAVQHLSCCENIAVVGIDSSFGRMKNLSLLVVCSWDQVYIFDLLLFRKKTFEPELKNILESDGIKKIVHDSRKLVDCLWHCHKVKLTNIFDTSVAQLMLEKKQTRNMPKVIKNISESLEHYLNFPSKLLEDALEVTTSEWEERPLLNSKKVKAAQLAAFLITLKEKQEKLLLEDFYRATQVFSQLTVNADGFSILKSSNNQEASIPEQIKKYLI